jgi:hypothetical protein
MNRLVCIAAALIAICNFICIPPTLAHDDPVMTGMNWRDRPERSIVASLKHPGISILPGEKLRVDLLLNNLGRRDEMVMARVVKAPPNWSADIKYLGSPVTGIYLASAEFTALELVAGPTNMQKARPGKYKLVVQVMAQDGKFKQSFHHRSHRDRGRKNRPGAGVTTSYPVLRGPTGSDL